MRTIAQTLTGRSVKLTAQSVPTVYGVIDVKSKYAMTESQVESLAREIVTSADLTNGGRTTYLRVLVTHIQAKLGAVKRGKTLSASTQLDVLTDVSTRLYAAVLRGITTPDLEAADGLDQVELTRRSIERNRRSTFARSAKSTLIAWVRMGGDVRALVADEVTRDPLAAEVRSKRGVNGVAYALDKHKNAIVRLIEAEAVKDPHAARLDAEAAIETLQALLDGMSPSGNVDHGPTMTQVLRARPAHTRQPAPAGRANA